MLVRLSTVARRWIYGSANTCSDVSAGRIHWRRALSVLGLGYWLMPTHPLDPTYGGLK